MSGDCNNIFCNGGELSIPQPAVPVVPVVPLPNVVGSGSSGENCGQFVSAWASTCALTISGCPGRMCNTCPDSIDEDIRSCCNAELPYTCFQSVLGSGGAGASETPAAITDSNFASCATAVAYVSACESLTSNFARLAASDQASCLCYDANVDFAGSIFDDAWGACAAYASTADKSHYSFFTANEGFCASAVAGSADTTPAAAGSTGLRGPNSASSTTVKTGGTARPGTGSTASSPKATGSALRKATALPFCVAIACMAGALTSFL